MNQAPRAAPPPLDPGVDYAAEYDNRARTPEHPRLFDAWARHSAAYREERPPHVLSYGHGERETIDVFEAGEGSNPGPAVLFIHGGYWQAMDRSSFSVCARGLNARGISVGVAGYDLAPSVGIGDIVAQMRRAAVALWRHAGWPVVAAGHSAGGHLAACLLATDWEAEHAVKQRVPAAYAISGLFDLRPLIPTPLNTALRLDEEEAVRQSPRFWAPPAGLVLDCVVGAAESSEFHRQSRDMADAWGRAGVQTRYESVADANHFTVLAPLADADSRMVARIAELAERARGG